MKKRILELLLAIIDLITITDEVEQLLYSLLGRLQKWLPTQEVSQCKMKSCNNSSCKCMDNEVVKYPKMHTNKAFSINKKRMRYRVKGLTLVGIGDVPTQTKEK